MARNYAALPYDYLEEMEALNDAEFGRLARALLKYSMTGEPIALCGNERFYAKRVMSQEDRFKASYSDASDKRREAGKRGAERRWQNDSKNGNAILPLANDSKNGYTETNTETKTKDNNLSFYLSDRGRGFFAENGEIVENSVENHPEYTTPEDRARIAAMLDRQEGCL